MKKSRGTSYVGASGWSYDDWKGRFYPKDLPKSCHFRYYAEQFSTVELNATFYRLFPEKTFQNWARKAPDGFTYAVKMWRWITHRRRLKDVYDDLKKFLSHVLLLGKHLGPVLVQLPPGLHCDMDRLSSFLNKFYKCEQELGIHFRATVEFRHASWLCDPIYAILKEHGWSLCLADMSKLEFPRIVTGKFVYIRFHGRPHLYQSLYKDTVLVDWAKWLQDMLQQGYDVYAYFNNDYHAYAVDNAKTLRNMLIEI
ncbi:MAG: DUF72 domain-containing protein [Sedimentisphaerales bacterium]|nr:DUF72 domain-containing protein [Sedimentisphaerales bacterium]